MSSGVNKSVESISKDPEGIFDASREIDQVLTEFAGIFVAEKDHGTLVFVFFGMLIGPAGEKRRFDGSDELSNDF